MLHSHARGYDPDALLNRFAIRDAQRAPVINEISRFS